MILGPNFVTQYEEGHGDVTYAFSDSWYLKPCTDT